MYVDDCPHCGCPMIADEPAIARVLYVAGASCADITCACHVPQRHAAATPAEA